MAEILGVGATHSPSLITPDELKNYSLTRALRNERIPLEQKNPENWPAAMREEWGDDEGYTSALHHRERQRVQQQLERKAQCRAQDPAAAQGKLAGVARCAPSWTHSTPTWCGWGLSSRGHDQYENFPR